MTRVGLDSEWKPYFGTKPSDVALIQLSTGKNIYLLDVVELGHAHHLWKQLSIQLFENHEILKLGQYYFVFIYMSCIFKYRILLHD